VLIIPALTSMRCAKIIMEISFATTIEKLQRLSVSGGFQAAELE
jgi:hypothetical protein